MHSFFSLLMYFQLGLYYITKLNTDYVKVKSVRCYAQLLICAQSNNFFIGQLATILSVAFTKLCYLHLSVNSSSCVKYQATAVFESS